VVLGLKGAAPAVRPRHHGQDARVDEGGQAPLCGAGRAVHVRGESPDGHDAGLAVGGRGAPLLGGVDRQPGEEVGGPGVPPEPAQGGAGHHPEEPQAVGTGRADECRSI